MNTLFVAVFATLAVYSSASGILGGAILGAPTAGAIVAGPALGASAILQAPSQATIVSGPKLGLGIGGLGLGGVGLGGIGLGGIGLSGVGLGGVGLGGWGGVGIAAPVAGVAAITNGGGTIGATGLGAAIRGPPTAPVVVAGPSGKIVADGLWGPTANIGLTGGKGW